MLIGFAGAKGSGKNHAAEVIQRYNDYAIDLAFATPLKDMLKAIGITENQLNGSQEEKEEITKYGKSTRYLMQTLGTDWGRNYVHTDLWIQVMEGKILENILHRDVLITDVRFENEADLVRKYGTLIHIVSDTISQDTHISEQTLVPKEGDIIIPNNKTETFDSLLLETIADL
jgi:hypothetical protein